jgi:hypothetical protein
MDTSKVKTDFEQEADNSAGLLQLDQRSTTASSEEDRLAAGISTIGLLARKLSVIFVVSDCIRSSSNPQKM